MHSSHIDGFSGTSNNNKMIRHCIWVGMVALLALGAVGASAQSEPPERFERAIKLWRAGDVLYNVQGGRAAFFAFCENLHGMDDPGLEGLVQSPVRRVFVYARDLIRHGGEDDDVLRSFLREAHARGIAVECMDGDGGWIGRKAGDANQAINDLLSFQRGRPREERFDGMLFDVRPEGYARWFSAATNSQVAAMLRTCRQKAIVAGDPLRIGLAIPRWFFPRFGRDALAEEMANTTYLVVDAFVDQEAALLAGLAPIAALADTLGVPMFACLNAEPNMNPSMSFYEEGWLAMERNATAVCRQNEGHRQFVGLMVNDYQSYRELRRSGHSLEDARTWSGQDGRPLDALNRDTADILVVDSPVDSTKFPTQQSLERLQRLATVYRNVFIPIPLNAILYIGYTSGELKQATRVRALGAVRRALDVGFDGVVVDCSGADSLEELANEGDIAPDIVSALDSLAYAIRDLYSHSQGIILLRHAEAIVARLSTAQFSRLTLTIDGLIVDIPGPMYMRQRDACLAHLTRRMRP